MARTTLHRTIREQIVEQLRNDVISGRLAAGEPLREQKLANRFGVSRGPIRDALLQLTQEGLLVAQPHCGVRVGVAPSETVRPLVVELRRRIEVHALTSVFERITPEDVGPLDEILDRLRLACERGDLQAVIEHDMAFHRWFVERTGEEDLIAIWLPIVIRMLLRYTRHTDLMECYHEHELIVARMRAGDLAGAIRALEGNIQ